LNLTAVLRTESANTQCQAFKDVVEIVTHFPGLRAICLQAKYLGGATSTEDIFLVWNRANDPPDDEWKFWQLLAATCLAETTISTILEKSSLALLTTCEAGGLSVIECLLVEYECS
jgi:hypothetical protein